VTNAEPNPGALILRPPIDTFTPICRHTSSEHPPHIDTLHARGQRPPSQRAQRCLCRARPSHRTVRRSQLSAADSTARVAIANERSIDATAFPAQLVAVVPMNVTARGTSLIMLGAGMADLLMTDLARARQLVVVERERMDAIMRELQLAATGPVDSVTAPRVGTLVRARRIVVGNFSQLPNGQLHLITRVADTQTSVVTSARKIQQQLMA